MNKSTKPSIWTMELVNVLEWKRFEELCMRLFETKGFACKTTNLGSDEGIDIHLYFGKDKPVLDRIVHCKTWSKKVDIESMRAFMATMQAEKARRGTFVSRGGFTQEALDFAAQSSIHTIDCAQLLEMVTNLEMAESIALLERITDGDYITPTCAKCGIKLLPKSLFSDKPYWICANWKPHGLGCITKVYIKPDQLAILKTLQCT
ncbi:MAG TPA: restriction endonuclease [Burkholderiaceae bacterium]